MKILNLKQALELYNLLGEYIPEELEDGLEFVREIIDNISNDNFGAYADAICLMFGFELKELEGFSTDYLLKLFTDGLIANNIIGLRDFCRKINYGY